MSSKFSIYKHMAMLTDVAYKNISHDTETKNGYIVKQNSPANSSGFS